MSYINNAHDLMLQTIIKTENTMQTSANAIDLNAIKPQSNYQMNVHTESNRTSRRAGHTVQGYRHVRTKSTSLEAMLRWSLTRDMIRAGANLTFVMFTVIPEAIHVTLTQIRDENLETHQWLFRPETNFEEVISELANEIQQGMPCYLFLPCRSSLLELSENHLGRSLNRDSFKLYFPEANITRVDCFARLAHHVMPRIIGADTRHWLRQLIQTTGASVEQDICSNEFLTSAAKTDSAMILRLLVTPSVYLIRKLA